MTVYLAPSIWRSMDPRTMTSVLASITSNPTTEHVILEPLWNDALIARSRSLLATKFLATDADVMVVFDDDMVWNPADFWKLVEGARATRSIYCGPYVTRSERPHLASRMFPGTPVEIIATPQRRPVEIEYAATGFVAIHRDVFEAMLEGEFRDADGTHRIHLVSKGGNQPFYPFFATFTIRDEAGDYHYLSEDWAFSERARQLGFDVWMDQSIILEHMGWYPFTVADLNRHDTDLPSTGTDQVEVRGPERATGEPLLDTLLEDLAAFADEDEGDVRRMCAVAEAELNRLWETKGAQAERDWYRREDVGLHYLCDLAGWQLQGGSAPLGVTAGMRGQRVLDFGAGNGTFALAAARAGALVLAVEVNPVLREFTEWRAAKLRLELGVVGSLGEVREGAYDTIVCWHVFEHLEDPERALYELLARLAPGGRFVTDSGFEDATAASHHLRDDWDEVLAGAGLVREAEGSCVYRLAPVDAGPVLVGEAVAAG